MFDVPNVKCQMSDPEPEREHIAVTHTRHINDLFQKNEGRMANGEWRMA